MSKSFQLFLVLITSLVGYLLVFALSVNKPLTLGRYDTLFTSKYDLLEELDGVPKLIILAGSNGRVSHSARVIESITGVRAVNLSITAALSLDYQIERLKPYLNPGDTIYMPLEYGQLARDWKDVVSGIEAPYIFSYRPSDLASIGKLRALHAIFYFDVKYLISALTEMFLQKAGYSRRISEDNFNEWGDQTGHSLESALTYRQYVASAELRVDKVIDEGSYAAKQFAIFLEWAAAEDVLVVGGYPTLAIGAEVDPEKEYRLKEFYRSRGQEFLEIPGSGRYPRDYFFDTVDHLSEPYQIEHSHRVASALCEIIACQADASR